MRLEYDATRHWSTTRRWGMTRDAIGVRHDMPMEYDMPWSTKHIIGVRHATPLESTLEYKIKVVVSSLSRSAPRRSGPHKKRNGEDECPLHLIPFPNRNATRPSAHERSSESSLLVERCATPRSRQSPLCGPVAEHRRSVECDTIRHWRLTRHAIGVRDAVRVRHDMPPLGRHAIRHDFGVQHAFGVTTRHWNTMSLEYEIPLECDTSFSTTCHKKTTLDYDCHWSTTCHGGYDMPLEYTPLGYDTTCH